MGMTVAKLNEARISAQKARLVIDMVRNRSVGEAIQMLTFTPKKAAKMVKKLLESAMANAEHNDGADIDELYVAEAYVDEASSLKRIRARAKGRANRITKRSCHITVKVIEREAEG